MQIMIDVEMADPIPGGHIMQIAAIAFDYGFQPQEAMEILANTDRQFNLAFEYYGGTINDETASWWQSTAPVALDMINKMPHVNVRDGLEKLTTFVRAYLGNKACVWAKPPFFDANVVRHAYESVFPGQSTDPTPWSRAQEGDVRTSMWLANRVPRERFRVPDMSSQGLVKHYALHDCVQQVIVAQAAYRALIETARAKGEVQKV